MKSHEAAVVAALYNTNFGQVVSADRKGVVRVWDNTSGSKNFQFTEAHDVLSAAPMSDG